MKDKKVYKSNNINKTELDLLLKALSERLNCDLVNVDNVDQAIKQQVSISRVIDNSKLYNSHEKKMQKAIYELVS